MKQKFKITIADMEMNILSEGTSEEVEAIVNKVDRRIREICLRSPRISKNEAVLLCALEFCSERDLANKDLGYNDDEYETLRAENEKLSDTVGKLEARLEAQKEKFESDAAAQKEKFEAATAIQKEKYDGRVQIMKEKYDARLNALKSKLDELKKGGAAVSRQMRMEIAADNAALEAKKEEDCESSPEKAENDDAGQPGEQSDAVKRETRGKGKNKVGSMFDLLTFNDV